jgi:hypothetical protein
VQRALEWSVEVNDDGSAPGMYDLRIGSENRPEIAIECVGAVDSAFVELWNIGPAKARGLSVRGDWIVGVSQQVRMRNLREALEGLLQELEAKQIDTVHVGSPRSFDQRLSARMQNLCISYAHSYRLSGTGKVSLSVPGVGGAVDEHGTAVPDWIGKFLRHRDCADVLAKLERSRAPQRHTFVIVTLHGTPWPVASYLSRRLIHAPAQQPDLPDPLTAVWIVADVGRDGLYWDGVGWHTVNTIVER